MGERSRAIVRCRGCGSAYTGWEWEDGFAKIVGTDNCPDCGSGDFEAIEADNVE